MIHMIFELFVSSALICAYTSETPGACAAIGIAPSNTTPATPANGTPFHAFNTVPAAAFNTVPPR